MARVEIPVEGMHCDGCERTLRLALTRIEGVLEATPDRRAERVTVRFDPERVSEQTLHEHIGLCGFDPAA